ncbi:MAG: thioesterase family protein [Eubacteriales bacterium]|nr:thioesterase family protein [Eubacteriales bacterium]
MLTIGMKLTITETVTPEKTAKAVGSGELEVYATPSMITLMEKTSATLVKDSLNEGEGTVGTLVNINHTSATPVGMTITCESELVEIDRKRLVFKVVAYDDKGQIGEGTHERFIINNEKFLSKTNAKKERTGF